MGVTREALEAAIRADRDDGARYDVYADYLSSHGDRLGELIALERREDQRHDAELHARIAALRYELSRWPEHPHVGEHVFRNDLEIEWRWGLWSSVMISCSSGNTDGQYDVPALAEFAYAHPACVALHQLQLDLHDWRFGDPAIDVPSVLEVADGRAWARELHELCVGTYDYANDYCSTLGSCSGAISRIFPGLRALVLLAADFELAELDLAALTRLEICTPRLPIARVAELRAASLPALERLVIDAGSLAYEQVAPLVERVAFPELTSLTISSSTLDELAHALPVSPLGAQLEDIDVTLGEDAAIALAGHAARLPRLRRLRMRNIDARLCERLAAALPNVVVTS